MADFNFMVFFKIPIDVSCDILSTWLDRKSASRLDVACCSNVSRNRIWSMWSSEHMVFARQSKEQLRTGDSYSYYLWATKRQARCTSLTLSDSTDTSTFKQYAQITRNTVHDLQLEKLALNGDRTILDHVYCFTNLEHLNFVRCKLKASIVARLIRNCSRITEIFFHMCEIVDDDTIDNDISCPNLHTIGFDCHEYSDGIVDNLLKVSQNIRHLGFWHLSLSSLFGHGVPLSDCVMSAIARYPHLQSLRIESYRITDDQVQQIAFACPNLQAVSLGSCGRLTDEGVTHLLCHCKRLKCLLLADNSDLTDRSLQAVRVHCPAITGLDISGCCEFTLSAIAKVLLFCTHLRIISLDRIPVQLVPCFPTALTQLYWQDATHLEMVLSLLGKRCQDLTHVTVSASRIICADDTDAGFAALVQSCLLLRTLATDCAISTALVAEWRAARPCLQVSTAPVTYRIICSSVADSTFE